MELTLTRTYYAESTNGTLRCNGNIICHTIELPWLNNAIGISCIPEGRYALAKRTSTRHKQHLEVKDVPGRSDILIHPANDALHELKGCIAPVTTLTRPGIGTKSRIALASLLALAYEALNKGEEVFLIIESVKTEKDDNQ